MRMLKKSTNENVKERKWKQGGDLLLWCYVGYSAEAVVLWKGVFVEQHPLRQVQLGTLGSVARQRMDLRHVLVGYNKVVPRSIHITCHLGAKRVGAGCDFKYSYLSCSPLNNTVFKNKNHSKWHTKKLNSHSQSGSLYTNMEISWKGRGH